MRTLFPCPRPLAMLLAFAAVALAGTSIATAQQVVEGTTAAGALYEFVVPADWNGDLVVYAHGIVDPQAPIARPSTQDSFSAIRSALLGRGYAVASTSYSENGYALKDGAQRVHQLRGLFASRVGLPRRTLLVGHSLGAVIVLKLAEQYPLQYDGALPMCGFVGGGIPEIQYGGNARVLFDFFFPGVLTVAAFPTFPVDFSIGSETFLRVLTALQAGLFAPGQPTLQFTAVAGLPASNPAEIVLSGLTIVGFNLRFAGDILERTHGQIPFDNTQTVYEGSGDDAALNAGVERFSASPAAVNYIEQYYSPTGALRVPVLTLHTTLDPVAPSFHEALYANLVAQAGASDLLVQQSVNRYGHCAIKVAEAARAFDDLAAWAADRTMKPAGGDVTIP